MNKLIKGDEVIVIAGRDKGKRGKIAARTGVEHLIVEGVNLVKKHTKPNPMKGEEGGIITKEMPYTSPMWPSSMRLLARPIALRLSSSRVVSACAYSSLTALKLRKKGKRCLACNNNIAKKSLPN